MSTTIHLLDLPVEILREILLPLLTATRAIHLCPCQGRWPPPSDEPGEEEDEPRTLHFDHPVLPLLLVNSRLYAVARPLLYGAHNRFVLDITGVHHAHVRRWAKSRAGARARSSATLAAGASATERFQWTDDVVDDDDYGDYDVGYDMVAPAVSNLYGRSRPQPRPLLWTTSVLRRITTLEMRVDRLRSWIQEALVPVVADVTLRGSLRRLDLVIPHVEGGRRKREALLNPPLSGLVGLLADPYLESARLWVPGVSGSGSDSGSGNGWWAGFRIGQVGDEVDWRAAIKDVDPEGETFPDLAGGAQVGRYYY